MSLISKEKLVSLFNQTSQTEFSLGSVLQIINDCPEVTPTHNLQGTPPDHCLMCGIIIPEGRNICKDCEIKYVRNP